MSDLAESSDFLGAWLRLADLQGLPTLNKEPKWYTHLREMWGSALEEMTRNDN